MTYTVVDRFPSKALLRKNSFYLLIDNWNDWFVYQTAYVLFYVDEEKVKRNIGAVKIGQFSWRDDQVSPELKPSFTRLSDDYFSIGQDPNYYVELKALGPEILTKTLIDLRDLSSDEKFLTDALKLAVTKKSLFRAINVNTVRSQFRRLARGGAKLTEFDFKFIAAKNKKSDPDFKLSFNVNPESSPPTNIHVLIGRNGVGKTLLLNNMTKSFLAMEQPDSLNGWFEFKAFDEDGAFANLVSVTFSAFDEAELFKEIKDKTKPRQYSYIGLKKQSTIKETRAIPKSTLTLENEFVSSVSACITNAKYDLWIEALKILEVDPIFKQMEIASIADSHDETILKTTAKEIFKTLSSGHKIVLLSITRLVETVEERTLILMDEPEGHLHPPLLSAFIRALSNLLVERNGVAIIATHSPVVLQEVPASCVWKLNRTGDIPKADRLSIESFGENVGILTREVFGLEVTKSGFHNILEFEVNEGKTFEEIINMFNGEIGLEGKAILRMLIHLRDEKI